MHECPRWFVRSFSNQERRMGCMINITIAMCWLSLVCMYTLMYTLMYNIRKYIYTHDLILCLYYSSQAAFFNYISISADSSSCSCSRKKDFGILVFGNSFAFNFPSFHRIVLLFILLSLYLSLLLNS